MEEVIKIEGKHALEGTVRISGSKNATVALIPAAILANGPVTICGVPEISDVQSLSVLLRDLGVLVDIRSSDTIVIDPTSMENRPLVQDAVNKLRASYYFMGALLGKYGHVEIKMPGGCYLGPRPIDLHLKGFEALGAEIRYDHGSYILDAPQLTGTKIFLDIASVGATINIMMAAVHAKGRTTIENAAKEPEIIDVATLLNNMGARVRGAGTEVITIDGVESLHGTRHQVIPDRIEAGSYIAMAAAIGKGIKVKNVLYEHLESFIAKLEAMGVRMTVEEDAIFVEEQGDLKPVDIKTSPYPGFATDLQQPMTPLLLKASGRGKIIDTIYEKRVNHVPELARMGADIQVLGGQIVYNGPTQLSGVPVKASDLRAGAALVTAGLMAEGQTEITNIEFILRGYSNIIEKLSDLGADIRLIED